MIWYACYNENESPSAQTETSKEKSKDKTPDYSFTEQHKRPGSVYYIISFCGDVFYGTFD